MTIKFKILPEDFIVSEVVKITPSKKGDFALYLLKKVNLTTWDALGKISKFFRIPLKFFGYGGLKDKRAVTYQYITIKHGPKRDFREKNLELTYLGNVPKSLDRNDLLGNNFEITLRGITIDDHIILRNIEEVKQYGIPNYFDEQRFGSVYEGREFAAKEIIKSNYERALFLLLAVGGAEDLRQSRALRDCLRKNWGNWKDCIKFARLTWEKNLLNFLSNHAPSKRTFKRALNLVDQEYLFFLGNVYQSYLWNEVLKECLVYLNLNHFTMKYPLGELYFYREISEELFRFLQHFKIPYPSPKLKLENIPELPLKDLYQKVFQRESLEDLQSLRTFIKGLLFKSYPRPAIVIPQNLNWKRLAKDKILINFFLEKGAYGTLVIKRILYANKDS